MGSTVATASSARGMLAELLRRPRYEVFPLEGVEDKVDEHVPRDVKVTVTASPRRGLEATLCLSEELAKRGFEVVPHISARLVVDEAHLAEILQRLGEVGVRDALVIAGDVEQPVGEFTGALDVLAAMNRVGHSFDEIGIAGYPETHPFMSDEMTLRVMLDKAPLATYAVTQVCFDPLVIARWITRVRERGLDLPVYVGIPGAVARSRLLRISTKIGVGESTRFLRKHGNVLARLLLRRSYNPTTLIHALTLHLGVHGGSVGGFHIYTFNEVRETEAWRQETLQRVSGG
jgi:methylenetetrahydrofolate reductase (NADPH)